MSSTKETVLRMFRTIQRGTEFVLDAIPADKLDHKLDPNGAKLREIAFHISTLPLGAAIFAKGVFEKFPSVPKLMEALEEHLGDLMKTQDYSAIFRKSCGVFLQHYNSFSDKEFINSTYTNFLTGGPITYLEGFLGTQNHVLQHRGTLFGFLRSLGIPVSMHQYFGMSPLEI
ncbi:MAG: hypothetical protein GPJ54_10625 [Candidatus Heimdallarchaeota archaeon]|nr:hypothetical protein [Candidatus Heimdallarchaeota archaeon]